PPDVESYDPKIVDRIAVNASGMSGTRRFEHLIIPRHEGDLVLGPLEYVYFDTESRTYRTLRSDELRIQVEPGTGSGSSALITRPNRTDVELLDEDIRFVRTGDLELRQKGRFLVSLPAFAAGMAAPTLALLIAFLVKRHRARSSADVIGQRRRMADKLARKRLKEAELALRTNDRERFYGALSKGLRSYFADKFGYGQAQIEEHALRERLDQHPEGSDLSRRAIDLIRVCDMARFAPVEDRPREEVLREATELISKIENA
ncbi:MAG: BatD family protein, partial [Flavobacteriales bacterium]|nr:BatD family protein [Flavobacteriales bacterium]